MRLRAAFTFIASVHHHPLFLVPLVKWTHEWVIISINRQHDDLKDLTPLVGELMIRSRDFH